RLRSPSPTAVASTTPIDFDFPAPGAAGRWLSRQAFALLIYYMTIPITGVIWLLNRMGVIMRHGYVFCPANNPKIWSHAAFRSVVNPLFIRHAFPDNLGGKLFSGRRTCQRAVARRHGAVSV
ncbi:MAG: hypothetical protein WCS42_26000, partial [Verrucomicrobiota bacterium]